VPAEFLRAEEAGRSEYPFEPSDEVAILLPTLLHAEGLQHGRRRLKSDDRAVLLQGEGRKKDRNNPVLAKGQSKLGVAVI
jgi:hypothetical protein